MKLKAITFKEAQKYTGYNHRHNRPPQGHKFSIGATKSGKLIGVVIAGRPISRKLDDGSTLEITRCTTDGTKNANSFLYGAAIRAGTALGYSRIITYTLENESGSSLKAVGFVNEGQAGGNPKYWIKRNGQQLRLDNRDPIPTTQKMRWMLVR